MQTAVAKEGNHTLAIGDATWRRPTVHLVKLLALARHSNLVPQHAAVFAADANDMAFNRAAFRRGDLPLQRRHSTY